MDYAYAASNVVISRAGAISLAELCIAGKPSILVPSPNVAEDHQTKNANSLAEKDAALVIKDEVAVQQLGGEVIKLVKDENLRSSLSKNIKGLAITDSAQRIAKEIIELSGK
jgi:UDP-N-acetylglucosamine--N-acetylmuramyl-(pentapeptide) pyrophosphoryl-undecaprenol N-acetylglucosamine transferase